MQFVVAGERLQIMRLRTYIDDRVKLTPAALKRAYFLKDTKVELQFARIDFAKMGKGEKPTASQVDAFIKATPENQIEAHFSSHLKDYSEPAAVKLRQIRVGVPFQASSDKKLEARKKIDGIAKGLTAENFAQLAKAQSDDESAKKGGDAGWVNRGSLENALEAALDKL